MSREPSTYGPQPQPQPVVPTAAELRAHNGHDIDLGLMTTKGPGFAATDWILAIDGRQFYLSRDCEFVERVLRQDFAAFLHAAFVRAGLGGDDLCDDEPFDDDLLKASLAAGVVAGLCDEWGNDGRDFFAAAPALAPWALAPKASEAGE